VAPEAAGFSAIRLARLDSFLADGVKRELFPHVVTFVARGGGVVHHKAFGYRRLTGKAPLRTDDIFRVASQSKVITCAALMTLYEEGRFGLDDPVSRYLPAFKNAQVLVSHDTLRGTYVVRPAKSEITIRQLLTHTAGIPYEHPLQNRPEFRVPYFNSLERETLAGVMPRLAARPLIADPGSTFVYGLNTDVVGYLVEVLSGQPLDAFLRSRIFEPLGMKDTHFYLPPADAGRLVELYAKPAPDGPLAVHPNEAFRRFPVAGARTYFSGGAGLVSTVGDYARFAQMLLNGGSFNGRQVLGPKTVALMAVNQGGDLRVWDRGDYIGFGLEITTPGGSYGDLNSPGAYGWSGMYCTEFTVDPDKNLVLLVFTNVQPYAHFYELLRKFRILVYQALQ
jgi:CubicO group peptidase (beta-lactamase class C family)